MVAQRKASKKKGAAMVEYAILVGAVALVGILGMSVLGRKATDLIGTLAVILPGANLNEDRKIHNAQLIEITDGDDDTFRIDGSRIGNGDTNRIAVATGLSSSNSNSQFVISGL
jgi:Flp pilus assembly pilin Flp